VANCTSEAVQHEIVIMSKAFIKKGEMITMDYGYNPGNDKTLRWLKKYKCPECGRHSRLADSKTK
jgi:hypothetical protein